jgi:hypothetical protein
LLFVSVLATSTFPKFKVVANRHTLHARLVSCLAVAGLSVGVNVSGQTATTITLTITSGGSAVTLVSAGRVVTLTAVVNNDATVIRPG